MKKTKIPSLVSVLIITLITTVFWVSLNIYRAITVKPALIVEENISRPLVPVLDQKAIQQLKQSVYVAKEQIPENVITSQRNNKTVITQTSSSSAEIIVQ